MGKNNKFIFLVGVFMVTKIGMVAIVSAVATVIGMGVSVSIDGKLTLPFTATVVMGMVMLTCYLFGMLMMQTLYMNTARKKEERDNEKIGRAHV
jgi:hypothetical protein